MQLLINSADARLTAWIQALPAWLRPLMEFATLVGQPVAVGAALAVMGAVCWYQGRRAWAYASAAAIAGVLIGNLLKLLFHRTRPDTYVPFLLHSYSFPSGHATASFIGYGLMAWLAAKHLPGPWCVIVPVALGLLILLIGLSRVYLGAHYPTDVLGGWVFGAIVLGLIIWGFKLS